MEIMVSYNNRDFYLFTFVYDSTKYSLSPDLRFVVLVSSSFLLVGFTEIHLRYY